MLPCWSRVEMGGVVDSRPDERMDGWMDGFESSRREGKEPEGRSPSPRSLCCWDCWFSI